METTSLPQTQPCAAGETSCDRPVQESGWMIADAVVHGLAVRDSACVYVLCDFLEHPSTDSILADSMIQRQLSDLWEQSYPGDLIVGIETGGYLIERNGLIEFYPLPTQGDLCGIDHDLNDFVQFESDIAPDGSYRGAGVLVGVIHTHPLDPAVYPYTSRCGAGDNRYDAFRIHDGVSPPDWAHVEALSQYRPSVRGIMVERDEVWLFRMDQGTRVFEQLPRNENCVLDR